MNPPSRTRDSARARRRSEDSSRSQREDRQERHDHDDTDLLPESVRQYLADHDDRSDDHDGRSDDQDGRSDEQPDTTGTLKPLTEASPQDWLGSNQDPDVLLSVPNLGVDHIGLEVQNLHARVDVQARVLDLVELRVGADVTIEDVQLDIDNVRGQVMLKVELDKVHEIVSEAVGLLRDHPDILTELTHRERRPVAPAPELEPAFAPEYDAELEPDDEAEVAPGYDAELEPEYEAELETDYAAERPIEARAYEQDDRIDDE